MTQPQVLVVEDDPELREILRRALERDGLAVTARGTGGDGLRAAERHPPDVVVLDVGLPDADGRDVCAALRARGVHAPVLFLTARGELPDRLAGFGAGGDDYLAKPFDLEELAMRLRALIRRGGSGRTLEAAGLRLDEATHAAHMGDRRVPLTPTEFRLLARLAAEPGVAIGRRELRAALWPLGDGPPSRNTLDVHVARVRRKLEAFPDAPGITTVPGAGYVLK